VFLLKSIIVRLGAFLLAVAAATVIGCISATQFVIAALSDIGISIPLSDRLSTTAHDVFGMGQLLYLVYGVALLVGFIVASLCKRWLPGSRQTWFTIGGAVATVTVLLIMDTIMGGMPVAGARGVSGLLGQAFAGAVAGYVYVRLTATGEIAAK
jgi:hypothetical protein